MSMKSKLGMMGLIASMLAMGDTSPRREYIEPKETDENRKERVRQSEIKRNKSNGLTEFFYGSNSVWAINQKNADKKARKNNWI